MYIGSRDVSIHNVRLFNCKLVFQFGNLVHGAIFDGGRKWVGTVRNGLRYYIVSIGTIFCVSSITCYVLTKKNPDPIFTLSIEKKMQ